MKDIYPIVITLLVVVFVHFDSVAGDRQSQALPRIVVHSGGGLAWRIVQDLGLFPPDLQSTESDLVAEHYFLGDPIYSTVSVLSETANAELARDDLESVLKCSGLAIYEVHDGKAISYTDNRNIPKIVLPLHDLKFNARDPKFQRKSFRTTKWSPEGLQTEWFELNERTKKALSPGRYQLVVVKDDSECKFKYEHVYGAPRLIRIHDSSEPMLQAMKRCWDGVRELRPIEKSTTYKEMADAYGHRIRNRDLMARLVKSYFSPSLSAYPDLKCGLFYMAEYCRLINDKVCFEKSMTAYCKAPKKSHWDHWERQCTEGMQAQLKSWNPE